MSGSLSHSPSDVLRYLLILLGHGTLPSSSGTWPIYIASTPNVPDSAITITDTTEIKDGREMHTGEVFEAHGMQLRIRGTSHQLAYAKANELKIALDQEVNWSKITIGSVNYIVYAVSRKSGPLALGDEPDTSRVLFTINVTATLRQTS